jgi:hypothetical protein
MTATNLFNNVKIQVVMATTDLTVGSTVSDTTDLAVNTTLDMAGYEGVLFLAQFSQITTAGTIGLMPKFGSSSGTLTLAATSFWAGTSTLGGTTFLCQQYLALDIVKPIQRYVGVRLHRAAQNACGSIIAIQYGKHKEGSPATSTEAGSNWSIGASTGTSGYGGPLYACGNSTAFGFGTFAGTTA